jgi:hypothetical protein
VGLFAPDALFLPTTNPKLLTSSKEFDDYFEPLKRLAPLSVKIDSNSAIALSHKAVLFTGMDTFGLTRDGRPSKFRLAIPSL